MTEHDHRVPADDRAPSAASSAEPSSAPATARRPRIGPRHRAAALGAAAVLLLGIGAGGGALGSGALAAASSPRAVGSGQPAFAGGSGSGPGGTQNGPSAGFWYGGSGSGGAGSDGTSGSARAADASASQIHGVVTITTELGYQQAAAAGTGIVLTSDGKILTNNHVIEGATTIRVTVESTGRTYDATVVGSDSTHDVAVLRLSGASGLTTATLASGAAAVGDAVTAVGNAGGTGTLTAATGSVTALKQAITTASESGGDDEHLSGLIETDANVVAGDSGGPLMNGAGEVVGINTAASSGSTDVTGYAIPISSALDIATAIIAGRTSDDITIGYPAFLGVSTASGAAGEGAAIEQVLSGTPAESAGLDSGDTITAVDGDAVSDASTLTALLRAHHPGDRVALTVRTAQGETEHTTVTLTQGPAA